TCRSMSTVGTTTGPPVEDGKVTAVRQGVNTYPDCLVGGVCINGVYGQGRSSGAGGTLCFFFFQAEDGIRDLYVTGVQTCALPILRADAAPRRPTIWRGTIFHVGVVRKRAAMRG